MSKKSQPQATATDVRTVLAAAGEKIGTKGRLSDAHVAQYNGLAKEQGLPKYTPTKGGGKPATAQVEYRSRNNRTVSKEVNTKDVRAAAIAAGLTLAPKGRLPQAVKVAYAAGTLTEYVAAQKTVATLSVGQAPAPRKPRGKAVKVETVPETDGE